MKPITTGVAERIYDYSNNQLFYFKPELNKGKYEIITENGFKEVTLEANPMFIPVKEDIEVETKYNYSEWSKRIEINIGLRKYVRRFCSNGKLTIEYIIDETGKASQYRIIDSINRECDEAAIRYIRKLNFNFTPGIYENKPVKLRMTYSLIIY